MIESQSESVARIGLGLALNSEMGEQKNLNLLFCRRAGTRHTLFHRARGVLHDLGSRTNRSRDDDSASVPQLERAIGVFAKKNLFHHGDIRAHPHQQSFQFTPYDTDPFVKREMGRRRDHAMTDVLDPVSIRADDAKTGELASRIDSQDYLHDFRPPLKHPIEPCEPLEFK